MKRCLVLGGSGFIGNALVRRLKSQGHYVLSADRNYPSYGSSIADLFKFVDLANAESFGEMFCGYRFDECYVLASEMGGAGYIFSGENDSDIITVSARIILNALEWAKTRSCKIAFTSSACIYPAHIQESPDNPGLKESDAYPANCDSAYGWCKLFGEQSFDAYRRNYGVDIRVARLHNVYGPMSVYDGGREKAPAAMCRKVAMAKDGGEIEIWGDGHQSRSFLFIDDMLDGLELLMASDITEPRNIGSTEMVSINELAEMVIEISGKKLGIKHIAGPTGVRGRNSDNTLMEKDTGWKPKVSLREGMARTYEWIAAQVRDGK